MDYLSLTLAQHASVTADQWAAIDLHEPTPMATLPMFLSLSEADAIAASLPNLDSFKSSSVAVRLQHLAAATDRVACSRPWQGCKVDPDQVLPFPRYRSRPNAFAGGVGAGVWDLDPATKQPVVPLDVRKATVYEADALADVDRMRVQQAAHNGLVAQSTGSVSETYRTDAAGLPVLCQAADLLMRKYARRSAVLT